MNTFFNVIYSLSSGLIGLVLFVLMVFTALMFFDCLRRKSGSFNNVFDVHSGKYDKIIWLAIIIFSAKLFSIGGIAYYVFEKRAASSEKN
ncbi:MAG: hypothetical protein K8S27_05485 [Candidatus Omnitrophica bacterium]|nr:hypothetical protein [Candidatus Omnitrophota bacterium]